MTIAGKINALVIGITVLIGSLITGLSAVREYQIQLDGRINEATASVLSRPDIQFHIYRRDASRLGQILEGFLEPRPVSSAQVYDSQGKILARREKPPGDTTPPPEFIRLRKGASAADLGIMSQDRYGQPVSDRLLATLTHPDSPIHLTVPVLSAVIPVAKNLTAKDFAQAFTTPEDVSSRLVIGYVLLSVDRKGLLRDAAPIVGRILLGSLLITILCTIISMRVARRITAPLSQLASLADEVASGQLKKPVEIHGSGEINDIANVLNGVIGGLSNYKKEMDVDHHLLSMKVEERTSQLSRRNKELNKAVKEVTETKDRLRQLAYYDSLTSLPNRRLFTEQLSLLLRLSKRSGNMLALLFLDLDNFKRINDSLGHSAGDLLLREVGSRLSGCVRESDVVAHYVDTGTKIDVSRLGGDEFTVVLNEIDGAESAQIVAQRLIDALLQPMMIEGHELVVTPSIGIALSPRDATDVEGLLKSADTAMYHAKASGKNHYLFYNREMDAANMERLKLETDLRKAVERNELVLHYQPQVDTLTGSVVGAEALIRWNHPQHGLVPPFKFIPLAEEMGMIGELGDWVLCEACRQAKEYENMGLKLPKIAVNVSALQFNSLFIARVKEVLEQTDLAPSKLELELTEGVMMDDASSIVKGLDELKETGVSLSIDDFGTGYSSLSYLSRFPLDELKIDRSFVIDFDKSDNDASLVVAIIAMAKSLNLRLVAEGVETNEQYHFLTSNGAHVIQGYLFSKPVTATELQPMLKPWHFMNQVQGIAGGE